jgi:hypothetical protein
LGRVDDQFLCRTNLSAWLIADDGSREALKAEFRIARADIGKLAFGPKATHPWLRISATPSLDCDFKNRERWKNFSSHCTSDNLDIVEARWSSKDDDNTVFSVSCAVRP